MWMLLPGTECLRLLYYDYQLGKVLTLSLASNSVSSGNSLAFDVIGSKSLEIAGDDNVTIGNKETCSYNTVILSPNLLPRALLN